MLRKIVRIDEELCNGCGLCINACAEGAIQLIDGKARLVSETYCDGLGACIGECPQGAITIEEREAAEFDVLAVEKHLQKLKEKKVSSAKDISHHQFTGFSCPGSSVRSFNIDQDNQFASQADYPNQIPSALSNWPVQIHLLPVNAPYLSNSRLLISADCVPFAFANFHRRFLKGKILCIGCPKLDDVDFYQQKLTSILHSHPIQSIDVLFMEVPCCFGLVQAVQAALKSSGKSIPLRLHRIGIQGDLQRTENFDSESPSLHHQ